MSLFCASSSVFSFFLLLCQFGPKGVMHLGKEIISTLAILFFKTGHVLLLFKVNTLPELLVELSLLPD